MGYLNVFRPMGFTPTRPAGKINDQVMPRPVPATRAVNVGGDPSTDIAVGDAYAIDANGAAFRSGPGNFVRGIVVGFRFIAVGVIMNGNGPVSQDYSPAGTVSVILGDEDPTSIFMVQADNFTPAMIGGKFSLVDAAPDPTLSQSRQSITTGAAGTQFQAEDIVQNLADNAYGINAKVNVRLLQTYNNG